MEQLEYCDDKGGAGMPEMEVVGSAWGEDREDFYRVHGVCERRSVCGAMVGSLWCSSGDR